MTREELDRVREAKVLFDSADHEQRDRLLTAFLEQCWPTRQTQDD